MTTSPLLSICIPAFGRKEQVRNTLNSIYTTENLSQIPLSEFEVIISDNDPQKELESLKKEFSYTNFHYYNTTCEGFMNSFYVLTYAKGIFLKLHNSQELWNKGSLQAVLNDVKDSMNQSALLFYTSGFLEKGKSKRLTNFDNFMYKLSYWSSWSSGFCIWKKDFCEIMNTTELNPMFPHTSLLLTQTNKESYIINDKVLFTTQFVPKRGGHNKFHAFSYEYPSLINNCFEKQHISYKTKQKILRDILTKFLPSIFFNVFITRQEIFSSEGFKEDIQIFFPKGSYYLVILLSFIAPFRIIWRKIKIKYLL